VGPRAGLDGWKISSPPGFDPGFTSGCRFIYYTDNGTIAKHSHPPKFSLVLNHLNPK